MLASAGVGVVGLFFPYVRGPLAQALADSSAWAWMPNDRSATSTVTDYLTAAGRWDAILRTPCSWPDLTDPADVALQDVVGRLRGLMTPVQWARFAPAQGQ